MVARRRSVRPRRARVDPDPVVIRLLERLLIIEECGLFDRLLSMDAESGGLNWEVLDDLKRTRDREVALARSIVDVWHSSEDMEELKKNLGVAGKRRGARAKRVTFIRDQLLAMYVGTLILQGEADPIGKAASEFPRRVTDIPLPDVIDQRMIERAIQRFCEHDRWIESIDPEGHAQQTITYRTFDKK